MEINDLMPYKKTIIISALAAITGFIVGQQPLFQQPTQPPYSVVSSTINLPNSLNSSETVYVCPMHPEIISHAPGDCPICGMDLVEHTHQHENNNGFPAIKISPTTQHNLGIKVTHAQRGELKHSIEALGKITRIDLTARRIISPPIAGTVTYIVDKYDGDEVSTGELLFSISSEQLQQQQQLFQQLFLAGDTESAALLIPKLLKSGLNKQQIAKLKAGEPPLFPAEVYAQEEGYIFSRRGNIGTTIPYRFTVFNIGSNYQMVEVTAEIFERQWNWVKKGQSASMTVRGLPGLVFTGKVVDVEPPVGYTTRSLEVRLKFKTDHPGLSQSMFARINIKGQARSNILMVPRDTVIRTGNGDRVVLLKDNGIFQPVPVVIGEESSDMVEIISGLKPNDRVVSSGQFLIDSESNLQSALNRMTRLPNTRSDQQKDLK